MTTKRQEAGQTSQERQMIGAWLTRLACLVTSNLSAEDAKVRIAALVSVLEGQYDQRLWSAEVLRDAATRFKFFPNYAELKPVLDMWGSVFRVRDNPSIR